MSRKKKHEEHFNHERWLVSYADFITLLFALFVVLFASSQVDKRKAGRVALAIQVAFQEMGVFETSNTNMPLSLTEPAPFTQVQMVENAERTATMGRLISPASGVLSSAPGSGSVTRLQEQLEQALAPELKRREVALQPGRDGLIVSLREVGFFESGSATLRPKSEAALDKVVSILQGRAGLMRIEGHTDNVPVRTARFASNWELSTARATEIIRLFITRYGFPPENLAAAGYAEFYPVAPNDMPEHRAQNRRVDIVVLSLRPPLAPPAPTVAPEKPQAVAPEPARSGPHGP